MAQVHGIKWRRIIKVLICTENSLGTMRQVGYNAPMSKMMREMWHCDVCGWEWIPDSPKVPERCPKRECRSRKWNRGGGEKKNSDGAPRFAPPGDRPLVGTAAGLAGAPENLEPFRPQPSVLDCGPDVAKSMGIETEDLIARQVGSGGGMEDAAAASKRQGVAVPDTRPSAAAPDEAPAGSSPATSPSAGDMTWADYNASDGDTEIEEPEEPHDRSMCQIQDCPKCKAIYEQERRRYRRSER